MAHGLGQQGMAGLSPAAHGMTYNDVARMAAKDSVAIFLH